MRVDPEAGRSLGEQAVVLARNAADPFCYDRACELRSRAFVARTLRRGPRGARGERRPRPTGRWPRLAAALPLRNLAIIAYRQQDYDTSLARCSKESLHAARGGRAKSEFLSRSTETLAEVMAAAGEDAARRASLRRGRNAARGRGGFGPRLLSCRLRTGDWHGADRSRRAEV